MDAQGRHLMINCEGEGLTPPVSADGLCEFVAKFLSEKLRHDYMQDGLDVSAYEISDAIAAYERGER